MGIVKEGLGTVIGNAGEYLVVGELLKRGVIAALAPRNSPGFDVLATSGIDLVNIRVKTKSKAAQSWVWIRRKDGTFFRGILGLADITVMVDIGDDRSTPQFYIAFTSTVEKELMSSFDRWVNSPGMRGQPHNPDSRMLRVGDDKEHIQLLEQWKSRWDIVLTQLAKGSGIAG